MRNWLATLFNKIWYGRSFLSYLLLPLSWLYALIVNIRQVAYQQGIFKIQFVDVPVIIVGNITVGGTGKTPLVIWLIKFLRENGYKPGIVIRVYGGRDSRFTQQVRPDSDPATVGDEAIMHAQRCNCPISVNRDRVEAARSLLEHTDCDIIISDDGLQHYALGRDVEIAVIDGIRRLGNRRYLPAGPLRESEKRLDGVDFIVTQGVPARGEYSMSLHGKMARNLYDEKISRGLDSFVGKNIHAVTAIGNPAKFFTHLKTSGLTFKEHEFVDHYVFRESDLDFGEDAEILMTEKDAVKCRRFARTNYWYVPVEAKLNENFGPRLLELLKKRTPNG